ncbi:plexin-A3-like [Aphis gossypii]|uniref:plexin-A3-like n=1 Tax=Aphis gossypii TaxID=80765 RepID=UPI00215901C1|nr:plexin-A3-like [Aphis gossypii]
MGHWGAQAAPLKSTTGELTNIDNMFVSKRSKKRLRNNSFSNRLWLATVIMMTASTGITIAAAAVESPSTLAPEQTTAAPARPNVTVDCVRRVTCAECAAAAPACSWSLVHQSCNDTAATEKQLIEDPGDDGHHHPPTRPVADAGSCPRFKVDYQKQTTMDATNRTLNVKVSNDPTGTFRALLERGRVLCHLNEMEFPGKVESGGRQITCQADHLESANSSLSSIVYFYASVNGAALTFDDKRDHYLDFAVPRNACVTENPVGPSDECKVCLWDDDRAYRYYCQWCPKSNPCTGSYQQCDVRRLSDPGRTVAVQDVLVQCPEVRIESIEPLYGSWAGGTTVRIVISNHRTLSENKVTVVKVADSRCLLPTASVDGTTVTCTIPPTNSSALNQGPVEVTYRSEVNKLLPTFTLRSNQTFYFVEPVITNVWPSCGPVTGGTRVTIRGRFLDAGNTVRVYMRDNITCAVQTHSQNEVTCLTGASDGPSASAIRVEFDHYLNKYVYDPPFMYTSAPALDGGQSFRGISSGGTQLPVHGHDFACIHNPLVHVSYNGIQYTGSCAVRNDTFMVCTAPTINRPAPHQVTALQFGFQADYNDTIVKMPLPADTPDYTLYPDPVYTNFETEGRTVTVYGLNIDQGYDRDADLSVLFHKTGVPCNVTSVQPDRIVCRPPKGLLFNDHGGRSDDGRVDGYGGGDEDDDDDLPAALVNDEIIVTVGNLVYEVKRKPQTRRRTFPIRINTIIFGGIALVSLIITIVAAIVYCMKIAMTISQQQTEMRSLCEHLNSTESGLGVCTGTETGSKGDVESAAAAAPVKDRS